MRIFLRLVISICMVAMIAACGNESKTVDGVSTSPKSNTDAPKTNEVKTEPSLEELAKKEGKVIFYSSSSKAEMDPILEPFTKKYGIQVEYLLLRGNEMLERIKTESRTGKYTADLADTGPTTLAILKKEGLFKAVKTEGADKVLGTDPKGFYVGTVVNVYGMLVNTKLVSEEDMPKTWKDLLDPKWKGKILSDDPRAAGGASTVFTTFKDNKDYGRPFLESLAKQNITITRQYLENEKALARGEYSIYLPALGDSLRRLKGAPVKWIAPDELTPIIPQSHGILNNAPHPNAAKLLSDYIITDEAQKLLANIRVPARIDIDPAQPEAKIQGKNLVKLTDEQIAEQPNNFKIFAEIFK